MNDLDEFITIEIEALKSQTRVNEATLTFLKSLDKRITELETKIENKKK